MNCHFWNQTIVQNSEWKQKTDCPFASEKDHQNHVTDHRATFHHAPDHHHELDHHETDHLATDHHELDHQIHGNSKHLERCWELSKVTQKFHHLQD